MDLDVKVPQVIFVRYGADSGNPGSRGCVNTVGGTLRLLRKEYAYGSAINRSVSLMIRLGRAILKCGYRMFLVYWSGVLREWAEEYWFEVQFARTDRAFLIIRLLLEAFRSRRGGLFTQQVQMLRVRARDGGAGLETRLVGGAFLRAVARCRSVYEAIEERGRSRRSQEQ